MIRIKLIQAGYVIYYYFPAGVSRTRHDPLYQGDIESFPFERLIRCRYATAEEKACERFRPEKLRGAV